MGETIVNDSVTPGPATSHEPLTPFARLKTPAARLHGKRIAWFVAGLIAVFVALHLSPFESFNEPTHKIVCAVLAGLGMVLAAVYTLLPRSWARALLFVLFLGGVFATVRGNAERIDHLDYYDAACYYLGGKYSAELGPFDLYPAVIHADAKGRRWAHRGEQYWAQDRDGFEKKSHRHADRRGLKVKRTKFSKERWRDFRKDVSYLQKQLGRGGFRNFVGDKGFNATPAWIAYMGPILNALPVDTIELLAKADLVLLGGAFALVYAAFGIDAFLFGLFYFSTSISIRWLVPGSVIMRYDWLALLLLAMSLLQLGKAKSAGALAAIGGLLRLFPLVWIFGPLSQWLLGFFKKAEVSAPRPLLNRLLIVFFLVTFAVEALAVARVGVQIAQDHALKMGHHTSAEMISSKRPGFAMALSYRGELERKQLSGKHRERMAEEVPLKWGLSALILAGLAWGLRRRTPAEAFAFGYVPFFLLSTGTYYYHIARITLVVMHGSDMTRLRNRIGLALLFLLEVTSHVIYVALSGHQVFWTAFLSIGLSVYCLLMVVWMAVEARAR